MLAEALVIVLLVSFFSLGLRTGLVVALSIPLVLAMTFAAMHYFGIGLHKISSAPWCWRWDYWWTTRSSRWR